MFILPSRARPAEGALHSAWEPQIVSTETAGAPRDARSISRALGGWGGGGALKSQELQQLHVQEAEAPTARSLPDAGRRPATHSPPAQVVSKSPKRRAHSAKCLIRINRVSDRTA